ncbi:MAG: single-stranded-DNA-specific exonuclease RecJ [Coriobacteriia bacterium]|nr:single-stranded-DNA-specific exonuclease RecJ [Coriobacteriia bacterium]
MTEAACPRSPWRLARVDEAACRRLAEEGGFSPVMARLLASRGISEPARARAFLAPSLDLSWRPPEELPGMPEAAAEVAAAVREGKRIVVFGDFDLDGISAAAVGACGLGALGGEAVALVPHRFREGYGLSEPAIERILAERPGLVVTVDCGISSAAEVDRLLAAGVRAVVTDHHEPGAGVPRGVPVVDAKLAGREAPGCDLAGAGVALKLVQAVGRALGDTEGWRELTDLASLGTVADVVPLLGENRALVADGLARMRSRPRAGVAALAHVAGVEIDSVVSEQVAFWLAPRLNAAGRMADPALALELLLAEEPLHAAELARTLDEHNRLRQAAEQDLFEEAEALAREGLRPGDRALVLAGEGWHDGVKGIVAARLASAFGVPTLLFRTEDGAAVGSGRTWGRVDLYETVSAAADLLDRFGGHAAAVGLSLPADRLDEFRERMAGTLATLPESAFAVETVVDAEVALETLSLELEAEIALLEPFGHANPRPLLATRGVFMNGRRRVGRDGTHLRFDAFDGAVSVGAIAFRCRDIESLTECCQAVDLAYQLNADEWRGRRRVAMQVREVRPRPAPRDAPAAELVEDLFARAEEVLARAEEAYAGIGEADAFHSKLAGVTFEGRQDVVARLRPGTPLRLDRQPDNSHDPNACALFDAAGDQVGFLNRHLAAALAPVLDAGVEYDVEVTEVTGGEPPAGSAAEEGPRSLGVNVLLSRRDASAEASEAVEAALERRAALAGLAPDALEAALLRHFIGEREPHSAQREALAHLDRGRSCLTVMATGRGKSLIFHVHAARRAIACAEASVFVYPLRALVADQAFHLEESLAAIGVSCRTVTGESTLTERDALFSQLAEGRADVVLTTPEFLELDSARFAESGRVRFLVVDEAHHVGRTAGGHRPAYGRLGRVLEVLGGPVVCAVTATAGDAAAGAVREVLGIETVVADPTVRENLSLEDRRGAAGRAEEKDVYLAALAARGEKLIAYVNSREQSVRIARTLRGRVPGVAWRVAYYNGGLTRSARHAVERAFRDGEITVVVATSAFGEGVNVADVRHVVLYHLPFNDVEFNQTCGRAGRDGAPAAVHLLFGPNDARLNEMILSSSAPSREDLGALYLTLREMQAGSEGGPFEVTNAELAERVRRRDRRSRLTDRGVSAGIGVFRELGLATGEGSGSYRRLRVPDAQRRVDLTSSVRYAEGLREIEAFESFRAWVLGAPAEELLAHLNRPILPSPVA